MFMDARAFNSDIGNWDTANVTNMHYMFWNAKIFVQDISGWCVEKISNRPTAFDDDTDPSWDASMKPKWGQPC